MDGTASTTTRLLALAGLALSALSLAACSTSAPTATATVTAPATSPSPISSEDCPFVGDDNCDGFYEDGEVGPCPDTYGPDCEQGIADDTTAAPTATTSVEDREKLYLSFARTSSDEDSVLNRASDSTLIAWGHQACADLSDGQGSVGAAFLLAQRHNVTAKGAAFLVASANATYCPEIEAD